MPFTWFRQFNAESSVKSRAYALRRSEVTASGFNKVKSICLFIANLSKYSIRKR